MMATSIHRRGTLLVVVMGLISLMLALTIGLAAQVGESTREVGVIQREAQACIMLANAKMLAARKYQDKYYTVPGPKNPPIGDFTMGDGGLPNGVTFTPSRLFEGGLGWARVKMPAFPATKGAWTVRVIAAGGGAGKKKWKTGSQADDYSLPATDQERREMATATTYERRRVYDVVIDGDVNDGTASPDGMFLRWNRIVPVNADFNYNSAVNW